MATRFASERQNYVSRSSVAGFEWTQHLVEIARQTEHAVRIGWNDTTNPRDSAMAANIRWIAGRERGPPVKSMGQYLQTSFGDRYVALGTAFRTGGPDSAQIPNPLSVDATMSKVHNRRFGLDFKSAPTRGPVAVWLNGSHLMRAENGYVILRPREAFGALLFVDTVRPSDHLSGR